MTEISGVIAFPSLHTVMACMVVVFTMGTRVFPLAVILNAPMIPATLAHGGHHLSDIFGGLAVFAASFAVAAWLLP
ncbi:phosphatase PAP2 family protein, partial [Tritonibacter sp. SIMBA_163]|uniref:phosphatase PAP2 family protein n=1 Tax=Tritonibacter sp. SIMBA_163 TaxID=3080868 RepID=UPI00397EBFA7